MFFNTPVHSGIAKYFEVFLVQVLWVEHCFHTLLSFSSFGKHKVIRIKTTHHFLGHTIIELRSRHTWIAITIITVTASADAAFSALFIKMWMCVLDLRQLFQKTWSNVIFTSTIVLSKQKSCQKRNKTRLEQRYRLFR